MAPSDSANFTASIGTSKIVPSILPVVFSMPFKAISSCMLFTTIKITGMSLHTAVLISVPSIMKQPSPVMQKIVSSGEATLAPIAMPIELPMQAK
ncbi:hypothetical protein D3C81_1873900 [compost metagenome]